MMALYVFGILNGLIIGVVVGWYTSGWKPFHRRNITGIEFDGGGPRVTNCKFDDNRVGEMPRAQDSGS